MKRERAINGQLLVKSLLAAANQAAGVVHRGTKNSFPRAGGLKRFKRAFLGVGAREARSIPKRAILGAPGEGVLLWWIGISG